MRRCDIKISSMACFLYIIIDQKVYIREYSIMKELKRSNNRTISDVKDRESIKR